ncbi:MAG: malto-oligosyltrehalose synthase [Pseudomonadota bacterium]
MRRQHLMPFGTQIGDGATLFRLWAPTAKQVEIELGEGGNSRCELLARLEDGWHEIRVEQAGAGTRYRYRIDGDLCVPDPASRFNPDDVQGASEVIDPRAFAWRDEGWRGRPWTEAVIYELHVGSFSRAGNFEGVCAKLDYLADLGVTAIELMPVADFPGTRNWGYDGVLPFAPDSGYGRPEALKQLIQEAHARGLMMFLDVVYNHFGPEGNYLHAYAPDFFNPRHPTPWGAAINFDAPGSAVVRDFFIHNAIYWLEEFHFDGLRLDAIHAICDDSSPDIIETLTQAVQAGPGRERQIHLILENDKNQSRYLARDDAGRPCFATAQWNDDSHHALHVIATGERDGYYADYAGAPLAQLGRCLAEGFVFQGNPSAFRDGEIRGEPSRSLTPVAFVNFLQTHDQIGNRAFGERLCHLAEPVVLEALTAILLLAPQVPMLFMGEEFGAAQPFPFFCDFGPELAAAVTTGRRREFARFARFADPSAQANIPDPNAAATFESGILDWDTMTQPPHERWLALHRRLLALRRDQIVPRLHGMDGGTARYEQPAPGVLAVTWCLGDGSRLALLANLGTTLAQVAPLVGTPVFTSEHLTAADLATGRFPPGSVAWHLDAGGRTLIPRATYRLQFNQDFTLTQATELVPYLAALGISHCYASPYLKARPGSNHGYDVVDHSTINPEIGSSEDFERFVAALRTHSMGQLLDIVPNHMGVMGADNAWWLDVLENGQASVYATYFDIDWEPLNPALRGKVLLPLLGDHYGTVLERGEIKLHFDLVRGEFSLYYYQHRLPVDPSEYPRLLTQDLASLVAKRDARHEPLQRLQSLVTAFGHLPRRNDTDADKIAERHRDKEIFKRQLAELCQSSPEMAGFVADTLVLFNGQPGDAESFDRLHALIKAQAYRLAYWQVASDEINYRRFFDINDLAALRMENDAVFEDTHRFVLDLIAQGKVQGLRIDHPDGLYDPGRYFQRLQSRAGQPGCEIQPHLYLVVEKIMADHEQLPADWPIHGATGYRFANLVNNLFVDGSAEKNMTRLYENFIGGPVNFNELVYQSKKLIMRSALAGELNVLANRLARIAAANRHTCDFTLNNLRSALAEVVACFPVYRSYIAEGRLSTDDLRHIEWAVAVAKKRSSAVDVGIFDFVRSVLTLQIVEGKSQSYRDQVCAFTMKFQQYTAPVMAKGLEDTAFYRYHRLVSLNDVGADPRRFGTSVPAFHAATSKRAERWPHNLLATSTHDSKRAEDTRARINVLSEIPAAWRLSLRRWSRLNRSKKRLLDGEPAPSPNDEYLLYQTLIGTWPLGDIDAAGLAVYRDRIVQYMVKAAREAKVYTSWINVNADYEAALAGFVQAVLASGNKNLFLADFAPTASHLSRFGLYNSLSQTLLKLVSPGVPDIYQGCELWQFHLVDPDNRHPVDYAPRRQAIQELEARFGVSPADWPERLRPLTESMTDGRVKLYLTWRALQLRCRWAELFQTGQYLPLAVAGERADHVCAFARRLGERTLIAVVPRFTAKLLGTQDASLADPEIWRDTRVELPGISHTWHNELTGECLTSSPESATMPLPTLLAHFPVALLTCEVEPE